MDDNREFTLDGAIKPSTIKDGMRYSLATGNWGEQAKAMEAKAGVSQVLNRYTYASTLSHLRRTNTPIGRDGKIAKPRQLHNTHWGMVCPAETPEGQACGLVKNLALMSYISVGTDARKIMGQLQMQHILDLDAYQDLPKATRVFVNGVWIGVHNSAASLMSKLVDARRKGDLENEISIVRDIREREIRIYSDAGRVMRPLFVVDKDTQNLLITPQRVEAMAVDLEEMEASGTSSDRKGMRDTPWENLIRDGMIEYLDAEEEEVSMIAMTQEDLEHSRNALDVDERKARKALPVELRPDFDPAKRVTTDKFSHTFTHCEIHPSMILGVCASIIPFPDHNQVSISIAAGWWDKT